jgi:structural maintenance of chromosome 3 (chondroitin sulfate proteoglycan 6)
MVCAVEFVLSKEFSSMSAPQRAALIHSSTGQRPLSASVEIVFDNTDGRFPLNKASYFLYLIPLLSRAV